MKMFLNPFNTMTSNKKLNTQLYFSVLEIFDKWTPLISKLKGANNLDVRKEKTLDIVMDNYPYDIGLLEAYVKKTALTLNVSDNRYTSLDKETTEDGKLDLYDSLTEDNKLNYIDSNLSENLVSEGRLWDDWVDYLKSTKTPDGYLTYDKLLRLISIVPALDKVFYYRECEILNFEDMTKELYSEFYSDLVKTLSRASGMNTTDVKKEMANWLGIYVRNREVLQTQFALLMNSKVTTFDNKKESTPAEYTTIEFSLRNDYLQVHRSRVYLFALDIKVLVDYIFDNMFSDGFSTLRFEIDGVTYYNALGCLFMSDGDLTRAVYENLCEIVLKELKVKYIALTDQYLYLESLSKNVTTKFFINYFGILLEFDLVEINNLTTIKGNLIHDYTEIGVE